MAAEEANLVVSEGIWVENADFGTHLLLRDLVERSCWSIDWLFAYFLVRPRSLLTGEAAKRLGSRVGLARTASTASRRILLDIDREHPI